MHARSAAPCHGDNIVPCGTSRKINMNRTSSCATADTVIIVASSEIAVPTAMIAKVPQAGVASPQYKKRFYTTHTENRGT